MKHPVELIKADHKQVKALFRRYERARKGQKEQIAGEIVEELSRHAGVEEQLIYPLLRRGAKRLEKDILNALEEHHAAEMVLLEIDKLDADAERFDAKMHVLIESVEMHIEEEEKKLLPRLKAMLTDKQAELLARAFLEMKASAPTHPHPSSPEMPGNPVAAAVAKVSDVGKDLVRKVTDRDRNRAHERVQKRVKREAHAARTARRSGGNSSAEKRARH
jgi:hemerythrin superfamily protein